MVKISNKDQKNIERVVDYYRSQMDVLGIAHNGMISAIKSSPELMKYVHSFRSRVKDPDHLKDKLARKLLKAKQNGIVCDISCENLFTLVPDAIGVRILHIYTDQMEYIDPLVQKAMEHAHVLVEGPTANCWDEESKSLFQSIGIDVTMRESLYSSVHYVFKPNLKTNIQCELQVRTLAEEIWGEVSHSLEYPYSSGSVACKEQIAVLARVCSGTTRLVDSIYRSQREYDERFKNK